MTFRPKDKDLPEWVRFHFFWPGPGVGRFWKRQLSKARRRAWKQKKERGLHSKETECNYKTW